MKTFLTIPSITFVKQCYYAIRKQSTLRLLALVLPLGLSAAETGKTFSTPEEAVAALVTAVGSQNTNALREIFGPGADEIANPDPVQAARERSEGDRNTFRVSVMFATPADFAPLGRYLCEAGCEVAVLPYGRLDPRLRA